MSQLFFVPFTMNTLILLSTLAIAAVAGDDVLRKPKLFFVSTSATTSTLSTYSVCYASTNAAPVACGRKRRTIDFDGMTISGSSVESSATKSLSDEGVEGGRDGRFLLYWITTTSISTSTSFTTTLSISSVVCTPSGVTLCG